MWTSDQKAAIEHRNANLLVSAAAGSGKTAVLVERIIQMILMGETSVDRLLVVTYTNAAAGEMRARIEAALSGAIESQGVDKTHLHDQIKKLSRSNIKTFHSFCLDVIRNNFQKIDVDPNFRMINDSERTLLMKDALEDTLESAYEKETPAFTHLINAYSSNRDDLKIRQMIMQTHQFILSQPSPMDYLRTLSDVYNNPDSSMRANWESILLASFLTTLESGHAYIEEAMNICHLPGGPTPYLPTLASDYEAISRLIEACHDGLETLENAVSQLKFDRIASIKKAEKEQYDPELIEDVKDHIRDKVIKKQIVGSIKQFFDYKSLARYRSELSAIKPHVITLCELTEEFDRLYAQMKREKNLMDFSDLEHFAIQILKDDVVNKVYRDKFDYIFVDEYQDSSAIQEAIVNSIHRTNNVFMVGDVKQSIYKFRLADPELFIAKYKSFARYADDPLATNIRIDLKSNFRTRKFILDQVNLLFEAIMSENLGDVSYDEDAKLYGQMVFEENDLQSVEVNVLTKKSMEDTDEHLEQLATEELEARTIARRIRELIGTPLYFPKEKTTKPCVYKDIVILLRSVKSWTPVFEQVFMEEGIPLYADSQSGYFDALEIKIMMSLLKIIDNPLHDLPMLSVLRSPMVGLSVEALAEIKIKTSETTFYYDRCKQFITLENVDLDTKQTLSTFLKKLSNWQWYASYMALDELIWKIIHETGFGDYVLAMPGGIARYANLQLLIDRAVDLKDSKLFSLTHFIYFIDQMIENRNDMGVASSISEEEDVVRLMSIHKSKGLEFPVVILAGMGRKFNLMDTYGDLILHKEIGIGMTYVDLDLRTKSKTLPQFVLKEKMKHETLSEEMRVLYVALTRPVDRLIVYGTVNDGLKKRRQWSRPLNPFAMVNATCFMDWVMPVWSQSTEITVRYVEPNQQVELEHEANERSENYLNAWRDILKNAKDQSIDPEIDKRLKFEMPLPSEGYKPIKISVSDLKSHTGMPIELVELPEFLKDEVSLNAAARGTEYHKVLEHLDFHENYTQENLSLFIEKMELANLLQADAHKRINCDKIMAFLSSELGIRIKASKAYFRETPFVLKEQAQLVQGVIDLYFEEEDGFVIVDYKTDKPRGQSVVEMAEKYRFQLDYYAKAIEALSDRPVKEKYIYFTEMESYCLLA